jgi:hypothetical protein
MLNLNNQISHYDNYIILNKLKNYIIKNDNINKFTYNNEKKPINNNREKIFQSHLYYPKEYDKLFWCFYVLKFEMDNYKNIGNKHFTIEKEFKLDFVNKIKANPSLLKENNIKKIETELDIVNSKRITLNSFHALCLYYNLNVYVLKKNIYYKFIGNEDSDIIHLIDISSNFIGCCENITHSKKVELETNKYYVENPNRPIRSLSFYKISDLLDLCKIFKINPNYSNGKSKKKQDLYNEFKEFLT